MSSADAPLPRQMTSAPPLSWPPPGLETLQGRLWRAIGLAWAGAIVFVSPLIWALAVEQPFYSLGPLEDNWQVGWAVALVGAGITVIAFGDLLGLLRTAANGAKLGYGTTTLAQVAADVRRDMGFLIQGKRHFTLLDTSRRRRVTRARLRGAALMLASAHWLSVGFGASVLLAARGFLTPSGIWLVTLAPSILMLAPALFFLITQGSAIASARSGWAGKEGANRVAIESEAWAGRLDEAGESIALGSGPKGGAGRLHSASWVVIGLFVLAFGPGLTIAMTTAIGPILASIAVPTFLAVQEMAGSTEVLRREALQKDSNITPSQAGASLQNIAFVGGPLEPEAWEAAPEVRYEIGWFPNPDRFPDPFSETIAHQLVSQPLDAFTSEEQAALRQAAGHPAQEEFALLARAENADVTSGRWAAPFGDSMTFADLPWPRFQAFRTAGLARVAKAAVEVAGGEREAAELTLRELVSTGFLLIDQGPTLIDNLMGVVLVDMGGDALEGLYRRTGMTARAEAMEWARTGARDAARTARAGTIPEDIHSLLQGIPDLVANEDALRGLRWEYFATFNVLAPCVNLHKMVFGPDDTYDAWRERVRDRLVRLPGERRLFELAEEGVLGAGGRQLDGFVPRLLNLVLGSGGAPGSCASLIASLQAGN